MFHGPSTLTIDGTTVRAAVEEYLNRRLLGSAQVKITEAAIDFRNKPAEGALLGMELTIEPQEQAVPVKRTDRVLPSRTVDVEGVVTGFTPPESFYAPCSHPDLVGAYPADHEAP